MPTPKTIIESYLKGGIMDRMNRGPDMTQHDLLSDRPTWPEEPSRRATECVENIIGELVLYNGFSSWWNSISDGWKEFIREDLARAWNRWDEEG